MDLMSPNKWWPPQFRGDDGEPPASDAPHLCYQKANGRTAVRFRMRKAEIMAKHGIVEGEAGSFAAFAETPEGLELCLQTALDHVTASPGFTWGGEPIDWSRLPRRARPADGMLEHPADEYAEAGELSREEVLLRLGVDKLSLILLAELADFIVSGMSLALKKSLLRLSRSASETPPDDPDATARSAPDRSTSQKSDASGPTSSSDTPTCATATSASGSSEPSAPTSSETRSDAGPQTA